MGKSSVLVVGLGKTGQSIARHLQRQGLSFIGFDTRKNPPELNAFQAEFPDVEVLLADCPESILAQVSALILSPGVSLEEDVVVRARARGCAIYNDIEWFAQRVRAPVIAITGTNGKSTVTSLVGDMAKRAGLRVAVAGNIGTPVLDCLDDGEAYDLWVLELSSFQLELVSSLTPLAATILNITPDHLDRHHTLEAYQAAKQRVYQHATHVLFNRADALTRPQDHVYACSYGLDAPLGDEQFGILNNAAGETCLAKGQTAFLPVSAMRMQGRHNWENALAATALAQFAGIALPVIQQSLMEFAGLPHRCEKVRSLNDALWINDSKGTNVGATWSAISGIGGAMQGKIVLIAGGQGKGADFTSLRPSMTEFVRSVVLIGEDADKLHADLEGCVALTHAESLSQAVLLAQQQAQPGDVVLLSPACASLDMFHDFNHRGEVFASLVNAL
jgi:UDP-N-acetylmuramoylalanine--D-glutamate ligase